MDGRKRNERNGDHLPPAENLAACQVNYVRWRKEWTEEEWKGNG
jgi:hypothetical protein